MARFIRLTRNAYEGNPETLMIVSVERIVSVSPDTTSGTWIKIAEGDYTRNSKVVEDIETIWSVLQQGTLLP